MKQNISAYLIPSIVCEGRENLNIRCIMGGVKRDIFAGTYTKEVAEYLKNKINKKED